MSVTVLTDEFMVTISIDIFEQQYLPLIYHEDKTLFNKLWVRNVAGSVNTFVTLVDNSNKAIDIVPPLSPPLDMSDIVTSSVMEDVENKERIAPALGARAMEKALAKTVINDHDKNIKLVELWHNFFNRRGYKIPDGISTKQKKDNKTLDYSVNDDY